MAVRFLEELLALLRQSHLQVRIGDPSAIPPTGNLSLGELETFEGMAMAWVRLMLAQPSLTEEEVEALRLPIIYKTMALLLWSVPTLKDEIQSLHWGREAEAALAAYRAGGWGEPASTRAIEVEAERAWKSDALASPWRREDQARFVREFKLCR